MVLASIVQKETPKVDERPTIAGVYLNRLEKNMKLQADPTVVYSIKQRDGFDKVIRRVLYKDLRIESIEKLTEIGFDGYAMGGLAVGEKQIDMFKILNETTEFLPKNKPRYLMGVGTPSDILGAVKRGIDMFDCVLPTRSGRTGLAFTWQGRVNTAIAGVGELKLEDLVERTCKLVDQFSSESDMD